MSFCEEFNGRYLQLFMLLVHTEGHRIRE